MRGGSEKASSAAPRTTFRPNERRTEFFALGPEDWKAAGGLEDVWAKEDDLEPFNADEDD